MFTEQRNECQSEKLTVISMWWIGSNQKLTYQIHYFNLFFLPLQLAFHVKYIVQLTKHIFTDSYGNRS